MDTNETLAYTRAIEKCLDGQGLLFLGSGFSCGARNVAGTPMKTGRELASALAAAEGISQDAPLTDIADYYCSRHGATALVRLLKEEFEAKTIHDDHRQIARIPWRQVYTTNYDEVFELATRSTNASITTVVPTDPISALRESARTCVHINGAIARLQGEDLSGPFRLTDTSYASTSFLATPWARQFLLDVASVQAAFFIGFSLCDVDIQKLLIQSAAVKSKIFFICGTSLDQLATHKLSKYGTVLEENTAGFAARTASVQSSYTPKRLSTVDVECLQERRPRFSSAPPTGGDVRDLLLYGHLRPSLLPPSLAEGAQWRYCCPRDVIKDAIVKFQQKSDVIIRSELGNGKTTALEMIAAVAKPAGFQVFELRPAESESTIGDLVEVARTLRDALILVDSYPNKRHELEAIAKVRDSSVRFLCATRTVEHDVHAYWLESALGLPPVEFGIDKLSQGELEWFCDALDENGFWRDSAARSRREKLANLRNERGMAGETCNILLDVIKSTAMASRVNEMLQELNGTGELLDTVVAVMILSVVEQEASETLLARLLGAEAINRTRVKNSPAARAFLDTQAGIFSARSSVLATHVLKQMINPLRTIRVLATMVRAAEDHAAVSNPMRQLGRDLVQFARVQSVLPDGSAKPVLFYYEDIRTLPSSQGNPQFWLQYAIALMAVKQYDDAEAKLETAYAWAKKRPHYDTYMLDTTHARWLLEDCCRSDIGLRPVDIAMERFRMARDILAGKFTDRERHYPYRVAKEYHRFFVLYSEAMSSAQRAEVIRAAEYAVHAIEKLPPDRARNRRILECQQELQALLTRSGPGRQSNQPRP